MAEYLSVMPWMNTPRTTIRMAYYEAHEGPRIMLFGPMEVEVRKLRDLLFRLSRGEASQRFEEQPFIESFGGVSVLALSSGTLFGPSTEQCPGLRRSETNPKAFRWACTNEGWDYLAQLVDGLVLSAKPGHQYLTSYPRDDAILVVSKGEYGDEVLRNV